MSKVTTLTGLQAKEKLKLGIDAVANPVGATLGPMGKTVLFMKGRVPYVTKDGVTVATRVTSDDPFVQAAIEFFKQVALSTNNISGDGTSTASVLAQELCNYVERALAKDVNYRIVLKDLENLKATFLKYLNDNLTVIDANNQLTLEQVATIAGNSEEVGKAVAEAFFNIGDKGVITLDYVSDKETHVKISEGINLTKGWMHPDMAPNGFWVAQNTKVLVWEGPISSDAEFTEFLRTMAESEIGSVTPLLIFTEELSDRCMGLLLYNISAMREQGSNLNICVVSSPEYGQQRTQMLEDLAVASGGKMFYKNSGFSIGKVTVDQLGEFEKVTCSRGGSLIFVKDELVPAIKDHIEVLQTEAESFKDEDDKDMVNQRVAKILSKTATIFMKGENASDAAEKRDRFEDAINATRNAIRYGVVEGGGKFLLKFFEEGSKNPVGRELLTCLLAPSTKIAENAGLDPKEYQNKLLAGGWNMVTEETGDSMFEVGVIDSAKSVEASFSNAINIARHYTQTDVLIIDQEKDSK